MSESKNDDKPMCWCGCDLDEDDVENCTLAIQEDGFYRRKDGAPECQFCQPRYWEPVEAISKWGFDDGNRRRMTADLAEALERGEELAGSLRMGYVVETDQIGFHNEVIMRIATGPEEADIVYDWGMGNNAEEDFKALPVHVRFIMLKFRHDDLVDLATDHEVPQEDLDRSKAELDAVEAELAAAAAAE